MQVINPHEPLTGRCPNCERSLTTTRTLAGSRVRCHGCGELFVPLEFPVDPEEVAIDRLADDGGPPE